MRAASAHIRQFLKYDAFVFCCSLIYWRRFSTSFAFSVISSFFPAFELLFAEVDELLLEVVGAAALSFDTFVPESAPFPASFT